ncbi:MAG: sulfate adenylyltransferase [Saprospiraceae bacterium]|nr:sulfate adenylyltransferase [Saprospiraceae bacterium]MBP8095487.1 sulfate adenylyltransferase [Saprospiraceae bacterium]
MELLRLITAGSVDDGKSTLIGRLLYDSKNIWIDQIEQLEKVSKARKTTQIDLALLTDGLRAEREQGITIDVAYRYFSSPLRKFIIADAPGHIQYTRNMVTGASNSELMILLIDARQGVIEQTRRHSIIASLLKLPNVVVTINKMDLVNFDQQVYHQIVADFTKIAEKLELKNVQYIPISALGGDNVVSLSEQMSWYQGPALLPYLENVELHKADDTGDARFQIQYVIRPQTEELHDYRGYAGQVSGAGFRKGDKIIVLPNELNSTVSKIEHHGKEVEQIHAGEPAVIHLEDDLDISRGDLIVKADELPYVTKMHEAIICWMDEKPMTIGNKYMLQQHSRMVKAAIKGIPFRINVNSLEQETGIDKLELNQVANISLQTASPLAYDIYEKSKATGSAILIDETSHKTVAAILFQQPLN